MGLWPFRKKSSKEIAKKRLQLVLKYDRAGLPPNAIEEVKNAILNALKDFPFIDASGVSIYVPNEDSEKIEIEIPVKN
ncbi:cell division topological specificity factor MinE [Desulfurobacterium thermolithotrophum DSM 11699]|uniref:Cell division topological specificity factor n=1 Tax=Desulfurobacterium thermolithotrophum (strain DSM 11699 / BSA) TaxID=868864 RepID=F0S1F0_DESTD|nr:cell division topological specificity factor MinE [Desulfurobacterium thermolithotrophum]ADY72881.1 cell division topological specificity factor MinE [Desulfurobacterium thermolithotrophum DSM 11699]